MFTVCPKCALTLVVTAADLRVAQGYVRCGRCLNVFNALARLSEERPAGASAAPAEAPPPEGPPEQASAPPPQPSAPASMLEETGEIEVELDASALRMPAPAPATPESSPKPEALQAEEPAAPEPAPEEPPPPLQTLAGAPASPAAEEPPPPEPEAPPSPVPGQPAVQPESAEPASPEPKSPEPTSDAPQTNTPPRSESAFDLETRRPRARLAWTLGAGVLAIALALQIVNHYRDGLAAIPALRGPLSAAYAAMGVKLAPRWNIHAYDVRQLGASVAGKAAGEIVVRASVKNSAGRAQPLPLLRVTLQDRFGNRIAARDVSPGDYLPSTVARSALLAAGGRVDATMVFVDPGPQAVGFEIDACLRQRGGKVACAHGP